MSLVCDYQIVTIALFLYHSQTKCIENRRNKHDLDVVFQYKDTGTYYNNNIHCTLFVYYFVMCNYLVHCAVVQGKYYLILTVKVII